MITVLSVVGVITLGGIVKLKIGDIVRLNEKALKGFYSSEEAISMYAIGGRMDNFDSNSFVEFISDYTSFYNGVAAGYVCGYGEDCYKVKYFSTLKSEWQSSYIDGKHLDLVQG